MPITRCKCKCGCNKPIRNGRYCAICQDIPYIGFVSQEFKDD